MFCLQFRKPDILQLLRILLSSYQKPIPYDLCNPHTAVEPPQQRRRPFIIACHTLNLYHACNTQLVNNHDQLAAITTPNYNLHSTILYSVGELFSLTLNFHSIQLPLNHHSTQLPFWTTTTQLNYNSIQLPLNYHLTQLVPIPIRLYYHSTQLNYHPA